jgi:trans-aconitate 2-methyltransferase
LVSARHICDLGCGSGLSTEVAKARWPDAQITGVDSSAAMLEKARQRLPNAHLVEADIASYVFERPQDLILANASLHWLKNHMQQLPQLMNQLSPGGALAVQMPNNSGEPSHQLMQELAALPKYAAHLEGLKGTRYPVAHPDNYYDALSPHAARVDVWETRYHHVLSNAGAIADWFASTALKPFLGSLPETLAREFREDYETALENAYARRTDGRVLLVMPRLFIVAQREK